MNKSILFTALIWLIYSLNIYAQLPFNLGQNNNKLKGRISGTVIDSLSGGAVEFASVSIKKQGVTKELTGVMTDGSGSFKLEEIPIGIYQISITFLGYQELILDSVETTGKSPDLNLGDLTLQPSELLLQEVVISGEASLIESKIDRLVYNAEKDISVAGGDASDVLRKVPLLSVDLDGNPSLRGSSNVRVLINGKPSGVMAGSVADALRMIPADEIKSVEVITSPSAKYDAEGTGGIINIITKKRNMEGLSGSINGGLNTRNSLLSGNLGIKKGRLGINSSIGTNLFIPQGGFTEFRREDDVVDGTRVFNQDGEFIGGRNTFNGSISMDYDFNAYHSITSSFRANAFSFRGDNDVDILFIDPSLLINQMYSRSAINRTGTNSFDWSTDYRKTFEKPSQEFSISAQISRSLTDNRYSLEQSSMLFPDLILEERSFNDGSNQELTFQADYVHPFSKGNFETGVKSILRDIDSDFQYEILDFDSGDYVMDLSRGNVFDYQQNVFAGYVSYNHKLTSSVEVKGGLRYEFTDINGQFSGGEERITNQFGNLVPSFTIAKNLKNFRSIKLNYSRRLQRPSLFFLNPFVDESDPRNIRVGNPDLVAEVSDQVEIGYNGFFKGTVVNAAIYYRNTRDVIQSFLIIREDGVSVNSFDNIGQNDNYGFNIFGQTKMFNFWTVRGSFNGFYADQRGVIAGEELRNQDFQYNFLISTTFEVGKNYAFEAFGLFNSQRVTLQGRNPAFSIYNFSFKKTFWDKKASFGINLTNPFTPFLEFKQDLVGPGFVQSNINAIPIRAVGINFSYRFGKIEFKDPSQQQTRGIRNRDQKEGEGGLGF